MKRKVYKKSCFGRISDDVRGFGIQHEESFKIDEEMLTSLKIKGKELGEKESMKLDDSLIPSSWNKAIDADIDSGRFSRSCVEKKN